MVKFDKQSLCFAKTFLMVKFDKQSLCFAEYKGRTEWLSLISSHFALPKQFFFWHDTSSCTCSLYMYCMCKVSQCFSKSSSTSWFPHVALSKHKHNPYLIGNRKKMAKFTKLSFCQKLIFWHQSSSHKCSICLYLVSKVSDCFSKSCGTSWFPRICTIYS